MLPRIVKGLVVFFLASFLMGVFSVSVQASTTTAAIVRAVFPNPLGSDGAEWVLIENVGSEDFPAGSLEVTDTIGTQTTYTVPIELLASEWYFVQATESGIVLNNTEDSLQITYDGSILDESAKYASAQDDQVWWLGDDNEWRWEDVSIFLARLEDHDFAIAVEETESTPDTEDTKDRAVAEGATVSGTVIQPTDQQGEAESKSVAITPYFGREPRLLADAGVSQELGPQSLEEIPYPEFDFAAETEAFVAWKRQALLGSIALLGGGSMWLIQAAPYWWQRYRWHL